MDEVDDAIVRLLKQDARMKHTAIAKEVGLSEGAVRRRVQNLLNAGIIKRFTIETKLEEGVRAVILVSTTPSVSTPTIAGKIRGVKGVEVIYEVTGQFDITAVIKGSDVAAINQSIDDIRRIPGVIGTNTLISLRSWH